MSIHIKNVSKRFNNFQALDNVSLEINSGELVALLGPSGSGKTTLLRIIAGLEFADKGLIFFDGKESEDKRLKDRNVGFVFQHYALFKHMTVFENVAFGLKVRPKKLRPSEKEIQARVMNLLKLVHIDQFHNRYPAELSGGQRQRVALARALAVEPSVLLLDEPFGALDAKVRKELRRWMRKLHDEIHVTSIFVTHDQEEAMEVADRIVVMNNGRIEQVGTPEDVYHHPANAFVYDFLGNFNVFEGWVDEDNRPHISEYIVNRMSGKVRDDSERMKSWVSKKPIITSLLDKIKPKKSSEKEQKSKKKSDNERIIKVFARPHQMEITKNPGGDDYIPAKVIHINPAGPLVKVEMERKNGTVIQADIQRETFVSLRLKKEDSVFVRPKEVKVFE